MGDQVDNPGKKRRRFDTAWVGSAQHFVWLEWVVRATLVLNVLDAILTIFWISSHQAIEANPLLAELAHQHPFGFVIVKMSLVSLGTLLLWRLRKRPLAVIAIFAAFLAYYFLLIYHLEALNPRLFTRVLALIGAR
ncbi:MAG: hypothetical protein H6747_10195 [Deltaproteobacteria bacterium]|nr:hypothetical protein [Deltaproteobacteria bacterium]